MNKNTYSTTSVVLFFMTHVDKIRCFVSLDFPADIVKRVVEIQNNLIAQNLFAGKYTNSSNIHLTLKFLGEISSARIEEVKQLLSVIEFEPFQIVISDMGVFSRRDVRIIWLKVDGVDHLQKQVDLSLKNLFPMENRFMGHVTIARVKKLFDKQALLNYLDNYNLPSSGLLISDFNLKQSILTPQGPIHRTIKIFQNN